MLCNNNQLSSCPHESANGSLLVALSWYSSLDGHVLNWGYECRAQDDLPRFDIVSDDRLLLLARKCSYR